jgi:hypothetical protein
VIPLLVRLALVMALVWSAPALAVDIVIGTTGTVSKANELTNNGTNCGAGLAAQGVDTFGNAEGCFAPANGKVLTTAGPGSPIAGPDAATVDQVHIADLTTSPTVFNAPTNPTNGARLTYSIYCQTAARALTWNAVFSSEAGPTLPTSCVVGQYLILTYRFNTLSNKWALEDNSRGQSAAAVLLTETAGVITPINCDTTRWGYLTLTVDATVSNPVCTPQHGQRLTYSIQTSVPKLLTWGNKYSSVYTLSLPTRTTGNNMKDEFGFIYDVVNDKWDMDASTQNNRSARLKTCYLGQGKDNGSILGDADLGPQLRMCEPVGTAGTIVEVALYSNTGTPSIMPHRETGTTQTNLLSAPLATAAGGLRTCARQVVELSENGATTCSATLLSGAVTYSGQVIFGFTSGTATGNPNAVTMVIYYLPSS